MIPQTANTLGLLLLFFVPGYLIATMVEHFAGGKPEDRYFEEAFRLLTFGTLNFGTAVGFPIFVSFILKWWFAYEESTALHDWIHTFWHSAILGEGDHGGLLVGAMLHDPAVFSFSVFYLVVTPLFLGAFLAFWYSRTLTTKLGAAIGLPEGRRPERSAWDFALDRLRGRHRVRIELQADTLEDNVVYGVFGSDSHQTSGGVFLEERRGEEWESLDDPHGIWLDAEDIVRLEVYPCEEEAGPEPLRLFE